MERTREHRDMTTESILRQLRFIPLFVGVVSMLLGNRLYEVSELAKAGAFTTAFYPIFWAYWMLLAGILCVAYSCKMHVRWLQSVSGAAVTTGFASRAVGVGFQIIYGISPLTTPQLHVIGIMYALAAFAMATIWFRLLRPATTLLRGR